VKTSRAVGPMLCLGILLTISTRCPAESTDCLPSNSFAGLIDQGDPLQFVPGPPQPSDDGVVVLEPFGAPEGSVIDPSGGVVFVRFDPPFDSPYTLESVSFISRTRNGVPAVFPSVRVCGADYPSGRPNLASPLFNQSPFVGSSDGLNTIPVGVVVTDPSAVIFVAIEFPLRGPTYPLNHPGLANDFFDLDRGYFSTTYFLPASGSSRQLDFVNAVVSARCRSNGPTKAPVEAPINLSANRIGQSVVFSFEAPARPLDRDDHGTRLPPVGYELLWRADFGPWRLVSSGGPGRYTFIVDSLPFGRSRWAVRSVRSFGNRSQVSNVEILDQLTKVFPQTSWGPEEPNGEFKEALPPTYIPEASIFPSGDRDFYLFTAHASDLVRISAGPGGGLFADRDTLDLAAVLYDDHGRLLAFDDNSVLGKFPQIDYLVPEGGSRDVDKHFVVEVFDVRGSRFAPGTSHRPASSPSYWYDVEVFPPPAANAGNVAAATLGAGSQPTRQLTVDQSQGGGHIRFVVGDQSVRAGGTLRVFDVRGRLLKTIGVGQGAGTRVLDWSVRDDGGRSVSVGVYFVRLTTPNTQITSKFILGK